MSKPLCEGYKLRGSRPFFDQQGAITILRSRQLLKERVPTASSNVVRRDSISLGSHVYGQILDAEGLRVVGGRFDEGHNHYFFTLKA
jgi:hypothetical protein